MPSTFPPPPDLIERCLTRSSATDADFDRVFVRSESSIHFACVVARAEGDGDPRALWRRLLVPIAGRSAERNLHGRLAQDASVSARVTRFRHLRWVRFMVFDIRSDLMITPDGTTSSKGVWHIDTQFVAHLLSLEPTA